MNAKRTRYDAATVKSAAAAHGWERVLQDITGHVIPGGKGNHPCPLCNDGENRFHRRRDFAETGSVHCRHCLNSQNGDGLAFIMKAMGWTFPETLKAVADLVGSRPDETPTSKPPSHEQIKWNDLLFAQWRLKYPDVSKEAVIKAGGFMGRHQQRPSLIIPVLDPTGKTVNHVAIALAGKFEFADKSTASKKVIGGRSNGFSGCLPDECRVLIKVEGFSDLLTLLSLELPSDAGVVSNPFGCSDKPKPKLIEPLARRVDEVWIFHDCDQPGQEGAGRFAAAFAQHAKTKNVLLPYPIAETKGKDLRDFIADGHTFTDLEQLANAADPVEAGEAEADLPKDEIFEADDDPHRLAKMNIKKYEAQGRKLAFWNRQFWRHKAGQWSSIGIDELNAKVSTAIRTDLEQRWYLRQEEIDAAASSGQEPERPKPITKVTRGLVANVVGAMASLVVVPSSVKMPCWLPDRSQREYLNMSNGLLDVTAVLAGDDDVLREHTPDWFDQGKMDYEFNENALCPQWEKFLDQVFDGDAEQIDALQKWLGYSLTRQTYLQKILFLVGPRRSGKGTILRILTSLLGPENVASPTSDSLAEQFGLQPLINCKMATITDARFSSRNASVVVERLLSISGEDRISVPIKHQSAETLKLDTKIMVVSNELPKLVDASGALASRMICLETPNSFFDREDVQLDAKLRTELSGILLWSLVGLAALETDKRIVQPKATEADRIELMELSSPVAAFANECCKFEVSSEIELDRLYHAYKLWCKDEGRNHPTTKNVFGRDLKSSNERIKKNRVQNQGQRKTIYEGVELKDHWRILTADFV